MCHRGGRRYGSYSPATPQHEGNGVEQTVLPHLEVLKVLGNSVHETHFQFILWMQVATRPPGYL